MVVHELGPNLCEVPGYRPELAVLRSNIDLRIPRTGEAIFNLARQAAIALSPGDFDDITLRLGKWSYPTFVFGTCAIAIACRDGNENLRAINMQDMRGVKALQVLIFISNSSSFLGAASGQLIGDFSGALGSHQLRLDAFCEGLDARLDPELVVHSVLNKLIDAGGRAGLLDLSLCRLPAVGELCGNRAQIAKFSADKLIIELLPINPDSKTDVHAKDTAKEKNFRVFVYRDTDIQRQSGGQLLQIFEHREIVAAADFERSMQSLLNTLK